MNALGFEKGQVLVKTHSTAGAESAIAAEEKAIHQLRLRSCEEFGMRRGKRSVCIAPEDHRFHIEQEEHKSSVDSHPPHLESNFVTWEEITEILFVQFARISVQVEHHLKDLFASVTNVERRR